MSESPDVEGSAGKHRLNAITGTEQTGYWAICMCRWLATRSSTQTAARAKWVEHVSQHAGREQRETSITPIG